MFSECSKLSNRKFEVDKEELEKLIETVSMVEVGKIFGVSDNAIRKRCLKLGIDLNLSKNKIKTKL